MILILFFKPVQSHMLIAVNLSDVKSNSEKESRSSVIFVVVFPNVPDWSLLWDYKHTS